MAKKPKEVQSKGGSADLAGTMGAAKETYRAIQSGDDGNSGKNIVLCSDGTGNRGGVGRGTNVWAIFNAVWRQPNAQGKSPKKTQIAFYDDGVGTQKFVVFKLLGGAFGWGYSRNIRQLYKFLVLNYEPGDSIYLFGFSRGAYTVRGLAGLVLKSGILNRHEFNTSAELEKAVWAVFRNYRDGYKSIFGTLRRWLRPAYTKAYADYKKRKWIHEFDSDGEIEKPFRFIGVWDTVDAVGLPIDWLADGLDLLVRVRFRDRVLDKNVEKACHAVSIDDERRSFWPVMWTEKIEQHGQETTDNRIEQVWFPGVHSNVGGGYPKDQVAQVALEWMMTRAEQAGLEFYESDLDRIREAANPHGKIYDSRAGLAAYYRYSPRDIEMICEKEKNGVKIEAPKIHVSALRRAARATGDYAPASFRNGMEIVGTYAADDSATEQIIADPNATERSTTDQNATDRNTTDRDLVEKMKGAFKDSSRNSDLKLVGRFQLGRQVLYYLFLAYTLVILGLIARFHVGPDVAAPVGPAKPWFVNPLFDLIDFVLPDFLFGFFNPLLEYARVRWDFALIAAAVLAVFAILKWWLETKYRRLSLDAWRGFREEVYPSLPAAREG